ncbi:helix-turn-helix transcriptional regulator [Chloroflexia bacterium SDU3-3]|nr:helix-turn-helix transcriptional regulator [Chloroflexia bacterium SDU3-3]
MLLHPLTLRSGETLTEKEHAVFAMLAYGYDRPTIARRLCVSLNTVESHRQHIYHKGRFRSRRDVLLEAINLGLMTTEYHDRLMM